MKYRPAFEDGTDSVPKRQLLALRRRGNIQKKTLHLTHGESLKSNKYLIHCGISLDFLYEIRRSFTLFKVV
jgi:hypothetical protein